MKKDQADEFERELLQPLAEALRTRLGDAAEVHINNEPRLISGERVEYAAWLEVVLKDARTEVMIGSYLPDLEPLTRIADRLFHAENVYTPRVVSIRWALPIANNVQVWRGAAGRCQ